MNRFVRSVLFVVVLITSSALIRAQTEPATTQAISSDPTQAIAALRQDLVDSFNKGDIDRLLSHLDEDVVITWQNGEVCRGPQAVRSYYDKMMKGPDKRVQSVTSDPKVEGRHVYGDWAVSWGTMNDRFVLTDGSDLTMNSQFTATIARRGSEWKVSSFHVSVNAFDNAILRHAARKAVIWTSVIAGAVCLLIGVAVGMAVKRRPSSSHSVQI